MGLGTQGVALGLIITPFQGFKTAGLLVPTCPMLPPPEVFDEF